MPGQDTPATRDNLMGDLFGRAPRVVLACWIAGRNGNSFIQSEAQDAVVQLGYRGARSSVPSDLKAFEKYELLSRLDDAGRKWYTPNTHHPLWQVFTLILNEAQSWSSEPGDEGRTHPFPKPGATGVPASTAGHAGQIAVDPGTGRN